MWTALKGFQDRKQALALASGLEGPAFDSYGRLSTDEKKKYASIQESLKREFMSGGADRMQAVTELQKRKWRRGEEPIAAFAYDIGRLVLLAYSAFEEDAADTCKRDTFKFL